MSKAQSEPAGRIWSNFGWLLLDRVGRTLVALVASVAVVRHLGPADFGTLSYAVALVGIVTALAGLGLDDILVRDLTNPVRAAAAWRSAWSLRLGAAAVGYLATLGLIRLLRPDAPEVWAITAIVAAGLFFSPGDLVEFWFQSRQRMRPPALVRQAVMWAAAAWRLALVAGGATLPVFAWANVAEVAVLCVALLWLYRREQWRPEPARDLRGEAGRLLREGWPLALSGLLVVLTMQMDRLLLGRHAGDAAVGVYAAAARFTEVLYALPVALGAAVMPRLATLHREDPAGYRREARRVFWGVGAVGLVLSAVVSLLAPWFVPLVLGARYGEAARIFSAHVWALAGVCLVSLRSRFLVIEGGTRWIFSISLLTALFNFSANLLLIPRHGGLGAAWATVGAWVFSAAVAPWFFPATRTLTLNLLRPPVRS